MTCISLHLCFVSTVMAYSVLYHIITHVYIYITIYIHIIIYIHIFYTCTLCIYKYYFIFMLYRHHKLYVWILLVILFLISSAIPIVVPLNPFNSIVESIFQMKIQLHDSYLDIGQNTVILWMEEILHYLGWLNPCK